MNECSCGICSATTVYCRYHQVLNYSQPLFQKILHWNMFSASFDSFLPRDAMRKRDLRVARCPSVCPSRWCTQTAEDIVKLLVGPGSFLTSWADTKYHGEPLQRGCKIHGGGWEKFTIFDRNRHLFRKRYEIGPWLLLNFNRI